MVGRRSPQTPSINRLTSLPDSVLSKCRRSRHVEFQHIKRRHRTVLVSPHPSIHSGGLWVGFLLKTFRPAPARLFFDGSESRCPQSSSVSRFTDRPSAVSGYP